MGGGVGKSTENGKPGIKEEKKTDQWMEKPTWAQALEKNTKWFPSRKRKRKLLGHCNPVFFLLVGLFGGEKDRFWFSRGAGWGETTVYKTLNRDVPAAGIIKRKGRFTFWKSSSAAGGG